MYDPVPDTVDEHMYIEFLGDVYVVDKTKKTKDGKRTWRKLPEESLATDVKRFEDDWNYGGTPWGCGDAFEYLDLPHTPKSIRGVMSALRRLPSCSLGAIEHMGSTYIGGWVPW